MRRAALLLLVFLAGCGATWPATCKTDLGAISCRCTKLRFAVVDHPQQPRPAGVLLTTCDGQPLPLRVEAADIHTERAP